MITEPASATEPMSSFGTPTATSTVPFWPIRWLMVSAAPNRSPASAAPGMPGLFWVTLEDAGAAVHRGGHPDPPGIVGRTDIEARSADGDRVGRRAEVSP